MPELVILQDLAIVMIVAGVVTIIFHLLKQPVVLGYILAGLIIGPHTLPMLSRWIGGPDGFEVPGIHDEKSIHTLSQLGLVFLMFGLGLHFSLRKLMTVGATALVAALLEIIVMVLIGYYVGISFGWGRMESLFLGAILSISSTTIIAKALVDLGRAKERFAELIFGILIVEDLLAIGMLAVLATVVATGTLDVGDVVVKLGYLGIFLAVVLVVGLLLVPVMLRYVARFKSDEMLLVAVLALCFGICLVAVKMGYSVALGAFLIGAIMAESRQAGRIDELIAPLRDMFSAVFFVAVGMLIDPHLLVEFKTAIIACTIAVVVGKIISCALGAYVAGNDIKTSLRVGMGLAQIGEFSFIIAPIGLTLPAAQDPHSPLHSLYPIAVIVSAVTTLLTPYLIRASDPIADWSEKKMPRGLSVFLHLYTNWIANISGGDGAKATVRRLLRKWGMQLTLNLALVSGLMLTASWIGARAERFMPQMKWLPPQTGGPKTLVWLAAILVSLPLLIASFRKVRAAAHVVADARPNPGGPDNNIAAVRALIANTILIGGGLVIVLWVLLLSSAILPPWPMFVMLLGVILAIATLMWNKFLGVYAKAQIQIRETLTYVPPPPPEIRPIPSMLEQAELETFTIMEGSPAIGKLIRELKLRSKTGASIVGIERGGESIVNPGADEELKEGDRVLLLGTEAHLETAEKIFDPPEEEEEAEEPAKAQEPAKPVKKRTRHTISKPVRRHAKLRSTKTKTRPHAE